MNQWSKKFLMTPKLGDHYARFLKKKDNGKTQEKSESEDEKGKETENKEKID